MLIALAISLLYLVFSMWVGRQASAPKWIVYLSAPGQLLIFVLMIGWYFVEIHLD